MDNIKFYSVDSIKQCVFVRLVGFNYERKFRKMRERRIFGKTATGERFLNQSYVSMSFVCMAAIQKQKYNLHNGRQLIHHGPRKVIKFRAIFFFPKMKMTLKGLRF